MNSETVLLLGLALGAFVMWKSPKGYNWQSRTEHQPNLKDYYGTNYGLTKFDDWENVHGGTRATYLAALHSDFKRAGKDFEFHQIYGGDYANAYDPMPFMGHRSERFIF